MKSFLLALQFLTKIPVKISGVVKDADLTASLTYYPIVGLFLGLLLIAINSILIMFFPAWVSALLVFALYVFITGGLHLDGFTDTVDGLYGGKSKEEVFRIMDDSRTGSLGAVWVCVLLVFKALLLASAAYNGFFLNLILLCMPVISRFGAVLLMSYSDCPKELSLAKVYCGKRNHLQVLFTAFTAFAISWICDSRGITSFLLSVVFVIILAKYFKKRLNGVTGDTIGFTIETVELLILIIFSAK
jgi:adenosylcobinamide-GDP ribazoletransferase